MTAYTIINDSPTIHGKSTITHFSWGRIIVNCAGKEHEFKDCKISPKGVQNWDWNEFKTRHVPGIQVQDIESIVNDCDIIILSRGVDLVLQTTPEAVAYLTSIKKEFYMLQSAAAAQKYNELTNQGKKVGILLHSTC